MQEQTRQTLETAARVLLYCWLLGFAFQLFTFVTIQLSGDLVPRMYESLFQISPAQTNALVLNFMAGFKALVLILFLIPWVAIRIVLRRYNP